MFVLQNNEQVTLSLPDITSTPLPIASQIAKFDLTMTLREREGPSRARSKYNTDLFEETTIQRLADITCR